MAGKNWPAGQGWQAATPVDPGSDVWPEGQAVQAVLPVAAAYVPPMQMAHVVDTGALEESPQDRVAEGVKPGLLVRVEMEPAGHGEVEV